MKKYYSWPTEQQKKLEIELLTTQSTEATLGGTSYSIYLQVDIPFDLSANSSPEYCAVTPSGQR